MKLRRIIAPDLTRTVRSGLARRAGCFLGLVLLFLPSPMAKAASPYHPIDLSPFYTATFLGPVFPFPVGTQSWSNVPYVLGGKIEVTGMDAARLGEFLPPHVTGIPVHRKASRLHLVHATRHGQKDGVPLANLVLHFKNGEKRVIRLAFGVHARNSHPHADESRRELADPNSSVVWARESRPDEPPGVRLFATVVDNPQPEDEIVSMDWVSLFSRATPMLFAVTIQAGGELLPLAVAGTSKVLERSLEHADSTYRRDLRVRVTTAAGGQPVTNASAVLTVKDDQRSFYFGQYTSDATGEITLSYPPQDAVSMSVRVTGPGFVPAARSFSVSDPEEWPQTIEMQLQPGRVIGGVVVDANNRPIPDAAVMPFEIVQLDQEQFARTDFEIVRTAADGKWTTRALSQSLSNLSFEVRHPEQRAAVYSGLDPDELLAGKAKMAMEPEVRVAGRVVNGRRAPLRDATVILDLGGDSRMERRTDDQGRFTFIVRDPTNRSAAVIVIAPSHAPAHRSVGLDLNAPELADIVLDPGQAFTMKMIDAANRPVPGVVVTLSQWQGSRAMQWTNRTGPDGRFRWDHAPAGSVTFQYEKPGYSRHTHSMTLPIQGETTFTYSPPSRIAGRVLDAETENAIDRFQVRVRYKYRNGGGTGSSTMSGSRGRFSTYLGSMAYDEISLVIEARGYEPFGTNLPPTEGSYSNVFHLKKARMIPGFVRASDGSPVPKAEVVLIDRTSSAYMDEPGKLRRNSSMSETVVTDGAGKFELTPRLEADLVVAAHPKLGFAQLSFKEMTNGAPLTLRPWGRVEGVIRVGDKVEPYYYAAIHSIHTREPDSTRTAAPLYTYLKTRPDSDGRFVFDGVPPGARVVYLRHMFSEKESGSMKLGHGVPITVEPGGTNHVVIGGSGRTVTGKVQVTGANNIQIDWQRQQQSLRRQAVSQVPPPLAFPPNATVEERRRLIAQRTEVMNARMRAENLIQQTYSVVVEEDGRFHAHSVPPGTYMLQFSAVQSQSTTSYRHLGSNSRQVVIPEGTGPHDVGVIPFPIRQ